MLYLTFMANSSAAETSSNPFMQKTIIVDAGHGGDDGGAIGIDGTVEKDINLDINEGEVVCIIGPSGSGKSTFLRTLNRMNDLIPSVKITGEVDFHGKNLYDSSVDPTWLRKRIGMVLQNNVLFSGPLRC